MGIEKKGSFFALSCSFLASFIQYVVLDVFPPHVNAPPVIAFALLSLSNFLVFI